MSESKSRIVAAVVLAVGIVAGCTVHGYLVGSATVHAGLGAAMIADACDRTDRPRVPLPPGFTYRGTYSRTVWLFPSD